MNNHRHMDLCQLDYQEEENKNKRGKYSFKDFSDLFCPRYCIEFTVVD
jgi:hypothetical protein